MPGAVSTGYIATLLQARAWCYLCASQADKAAVLVSKALVWAHAYHRLMCRCVARC